MILLLGALTIVISVSPSTFAQVDSSIDPATTPIPTPEIEEEDWTLYNEGVDFMEAENWQEAINSFNDSLKKIPSDFDTFSNIAYSYGKLENYQNAIDYYNKALKIKPADTEVLNNIQWAKEQQSGVFDVTADDSDPSECVFNCDVCIFNCDDVYFDDDEEEEDRYYDEGYTFEDADKIKSEFSTLKFYNVGLDIKKHWLLWSDVDKSEFPDRTYYSSWYDDWDKWISIGLQHDIGQKIDLTNFQEVKQYFENYTEQWCEDSVDSPIFFDVPVDTGYITCTDVKNFQWKDAHQVKMKDGRYAYNVSYNWNEKWQYAEKDGTRINDIEYEGWNVTANLIPYGDDLIVAKGEMTNQAYKYQKHILEESINSFTILRDGYPIFDEKTGPSSSYDIPSKKLSDIQTPDTTPKVIDPIGGIATPVDNPFGVSFKLDESQVVFQKDVPTNLEISGQIEDYNKGVRIYVTITDPLGNKKEHKLIGTKDGDYETHLWFDSRVNEVGEYTIQVKYRDIVSTTTSFMVNKPQIIEPAELQLMKIQHKETQIVKLETQIVKEKIPDWVKNNAIWWADGLVDDNSFKEGIQYMIKEEVININDIPSASGPSESKIPDWVKNTAKWWADGLIGEEDFVNGLKYMIEKQIISVN